jgi:hypothetical protein
MAMLRPDCDHTILDMRKRDRESERLFAKVPRRTKKSSKWLPS